LARERQSVLAELVSTRVEDRASNIQPEAALRNGEKRVLCSRQLKRNLQRFRLHDVALDAMPLEGIDARRMIFCEQVRTQKISITDRVDTSRAEALAHAANGRTQVSLRPARHHTNASGRLERLRQMAEGEVEPSDVAPAWLALAHQRDLILAQGALRAS